jgi:hypothetical protein
VQPPAAPPPPPPKDARKHERLELYASVELHAERETLILPARNISIGGVYLPADGHDLTSFADGSALEVQVFDALDERSRPVRLQATVVRHDGAGMALMWSTSDGEAEAAAALARLLDSMQPKREAKR